MLRINNDKKLICKLVLLGDTAVGKSCFACRHVRDEFFEYQEPTIGASFLTSNIDLEDKKIKFEIWDTAGQERYRSLAPMYYRGAKSAIIVYDITNLDSFNGAKLWVNEIKKKGSSKCIIFLVGNKKDLEKDRKVEKEMVNQFAYENEIVHIEASAKTGENINEIFIKLATKIIEKSKESINSDDENNPIININLDDNNESSYCCY